METEKQTCSVYTIYTLELVANGAQAPQTPSFSPLVLHFFPSLHVSLHMWYVTVLFPCPGAIYTQGKHRAVCVDDCQRGPFINCQASVLRGGKYTLWIMVVLVCRRNPTWQPAEGRDKIICEEIVYHGHGKHCPSHAVRAKDLILCGGGTWMGDISDLKWKPERCLSVWWEGGKENNQQVYLVSLLFSVGSIQVSEYRCIRLQNSVRLR